MKMDDLSRRETSGLLDKGFIRDSCLMPVPLDWFQTRRPPLIGLSGGLGAREVVNPHVEKLPVRCAILYIYTHT